MSNKYQRARTFAHTLTECLSKRQKSSTSWRGAGASYQTSHPGFSARAIAFGRSWPFAAFCYRPGLPVRHWGRDMSAPKPYVTNPTPTHSSRPPLSYYSTQDFGGLYIRGKSHFTSHMVSAVVAEYKVYARALLKETYTNVLNVPSSRNSE